mgnify:CR=1
MLVKVHCPQGAAGATVLAQQRVYVESGGNRELQILKFIKCHI